MFFIQKCLKIHKKNRASLSDLFTDKLLFDDNIQNFKTDAPELDGKTMILLENM